MIDVKTLRIGNWVSLSISPYSNPEYATVTEIGKDRIVSEGYSHLLMDVVEPIEITNDWLKRLGFTYDVDYCPVLKVGEYGFHFTRKLDSIILVDDEDRDLPELYVNHIRFLHELQNLIHSICGQELTETPTP